MHGGNLGIALVIYLNIQCLQPPIATSEDVVVKAPLYIYIGDDAHSQNIVKELSYVWPNANEFTAKVKYLRENMPDEIKLVHWKDLKTLPEKIPSYSYGEYDRAKPFPSNCFTGSCYSLFFIINLQRERHFSNEIEEWEDICSEIDLDCDNEYFQECHIWVHKNFPEVFEESSFYEYYSIDGIEKRFGDYDGFPVKKVVPLPVKPKIVQLWEPDFDIQAIERAFYEVAN